MKDFLELEAVYLALGVFALTITLIVTTRDFVPKGALKKGVTWVLGAISVLIGTHYYMTTSRMEYRKTI